MLDPFKEAERLRKIVCQGEKRKYYRFRGGNFYGGIVTADCVGCILDCAYCWSFYPRKNPEKVGNFFSPKEVAETLIRIAQRKSYKNVRISGNEPTLCKEHLLEVISLIPKDLTFILETNGILIDEDFAKNLSKFKNLYVRVSIKGANKEMFSKITGTKPEFFQYQLMALKYLVNNKIDCRAAIMIDLYDEKDLFDINKRLSEINPYLAEDLEFETLITFPFVEKNLSKRGITIKRK